MYQVSWACPKLRLTGHDRCSDGSRHSYPVMHVCKHSVSRFLAAEVTEMFRRRSRGKQQVCSSMAVPPSCGLPPGLPVPLHVAAEHGMLDAAIPWSKGRWGTRQVTDCGEDTVFGCGCVHQQSWPQPWRLFFASYEGCSACVRASLQGKDNYPAEPKGFYKFLSAVWPLLGASRGYDTVWVQGYLAGKGFVPQPAAATTVCLASHDMAQSPDYPGQPCQLFSAAYDGCSICVRKYLDVEEVNPHWTANSGLNALAWARWGAGNGKSTSWVQGFLEAKGVVMSGAEHIPVLVPDARIAA
jgi:hypothetical protein